MAKSIRSKWKRKCRAIKRERYAVKELARLKKMLGIKDDEKVQESEVMESDDVIYLDASTIKKRGKERKKKAEAPEPDEDVEMSSDDEKVAVEGKEGKIRVFSSKTFKDQDGHYPVWLHKRKIKKLTRQNQKSTKKKLKKRRH